MKKLQLLIPVLVLISSCSTSPYLSESPSTNLPGEGLSTLNLKTKFRLPASVEDQPSISKLNEEEFQEVLHSKNLGQLRLRLQSRLDAIEEVYFRARQAMIEFDENLNTSSEKKENTEIFFKKIINSGVYSQILALRDNNLIRQGQFIYFLKRFNEISKDSTSAAQDIAYSNEAFEYIGNYYQSLPRTFLIAHYQIVLETNDLKVENKHWRSGLQRAMGMKRSISDTLVDLYSHYHEVFENLEVQNDINSVTKLLHETKTKIGEDLKKASYSIQMNLLNNENARDPQTQKIQPGTGPSGNITGSTFPNGLWAITFDDGPHPSYTNLIANNLKEFNIRSTFFSLSKNVVQFPKITNGIKSMGMEIANHSHDHPQLPKLNDTQLDFQILGSNDKIADVIGEKPKYFRCPYGAGTNVAKVRTRIAKEDMIHVFWNVDSLDWQDHNPASIVARVKKQMAMAKNGGGIILFHDIHPQSVIASKEIMKYLKSNDGNNGKPAQVKTIGEIVDMLNK